MLGGVQAQWDWLRCCVILSFSYNRLDNGLKFLVSRRLYKEERILENSENVDAQLRSGNDTDFE
jgi:hypothetical protein